MDIKFRTELNLRPSGKEINHTSKILFIGSCFSENIGSILESWKINALVNPFGILYNPYSIKKILELAISGAHYTKDDLIAHNGIWLSLEHHSQFNSKDPNKTLSAINHAFNETHRFLKEASHLFITPGTSWVYEYKPATKIVANCHKIPNKEFNKRILSFTETSTVISELSLLLKKFNPTLEIIYTVSPVRHLKDGFTENQHSKSLLLAAIQENIKIGMPAAYFPSYELLMDDLRDYRYYADDLLHPNKQALDYISTKFCDHFISKETLTLIKEIKEIKSFLSHRPFNLKSEDYQSAVKNYQTKLRDLQNVHPDLNFSEEVSQINSLTYPRTQRSEDAGSEYYNK